MGWHGHLQLHYRRDGDTTTALDRHHGPLRVLQRLYPEGPGICHHVLVHPPGGIVGGDTLDIDLHLAAGSHAVITSPGASRFYRSAGEPAVQTLRARIDDGARLEWLPLETIAHSGCLGENRLSFELAPLAQMMGWDVLALGLPASGQGFDQGRFTQRIELPGRWLERGVIDARDRHLLDSPVGLAGHSVMGTLWFASGSPWADESREALIDAARGAVSEHALARTAGVTAPNDATLVLRVLADRVEPLMKLLVQVRGVWRATAWSLDAQPPRIWRT
jgi:urease accessory protein